MSTPEVHNECIDDRVEKLEMTSEQLKEANEAVSRAEALSQLSEIEDESPEVLLERMKEVTVAQREAKKNGEPFMVAYTNEMRTKGAQLGVDPSEYAGLRTKLDLSLEALA